MQKKKDHIDAIQANSLRRKKENKRNIPEEIKNLISKREKLRKEGKYDEADKIRDEIEELGYTVSDAPSRQ